MKRRRTLKIEYENERVKALFDDLNDVIGSRRLMRKQIGAELTKVIKKRYIQLLAFSSFYSIQQSGIGKMESLAGDLDGYYSMRLSANYRLIVRPGSLERSSEALKLCDTLVIEGVVDYHGGGNKSKWIIP